MRRDSLSLTQKEFAEKIGISQPLYAKYENNNNLPSIATIIKICEAFKVSSDSLLGLDTGLSVRTYGDLL